MSEEKRDTWDKIEVISKVLVVPITVALLGFIANDYLEKRQSSEERVKLYSELMSKREASESALRKDMFSSIIESFLKDANKSLEEETLNLELLAYNFHDSLNLKPLFIHLQKKILASDVDQDEKNNLFRRLNVVSEEIIDNQLYVIKEVADTHDIVIRKETLESGFISEKFVLEIDDLQREIEIQVNDHDNINNRFLVDLYIRDLMDGNSEIFLVNQTWITLFDFPTVDSVRLSKDGRLSVSITDYDDISAVLTVSLFPGQYASLKEKPYYEDIIEQLQDNEY